jgi:hypothetical protein
MKNDVMTNSLEDTLEGSCESALWEVLFKFKERRVEETILTNTLLPFVLQFRMTG